VQGMQRRSAPLWLPTPDGLIVESRHVVDGASKLSYKQLSCVLVHGTVILVLLGVVFPDISLGHRLIGVAWPYAFVNQSQTTILLLELSAYMNYSFCRLLLCFMP
jgi:hypothetical protein